MTESNSNAKAIAGGVLVVLFLIGGAVWFDGSRSATEPQAAVPTETSVILESESGGATVAPGAADAPAPGPTVSSDDVATRAMPPAIDTFFRNPDDTTVIAGRATPGQTVAIMLGGAEVDRVVTAEDGTFGSVVFIAAADRARRLRLVGDPDGAALASAESVIVPPSAADVVASANTRQPSPEISTATEAADDSTPVGVDEAADRVVVTAQVDGGEAPEVTAQSPLAPVPLDADAPSVAAPPTLIADAEGVRVIQRPDPDATKPTFVDNIALDTITYDTQGEVILAGRAEAGGFVQVYLDNQPVTTSRITADGGWQIDLPDVDTGVYTLRVDEVADDGTVQSRIETPFKREEPGAVAAIMAADTDVEGFDVAVRTVQPGATLWAIAEEQFGDGIMYVAVFEANRDQIRNPDLIYPGQVFRLPEALQ